MPASKELKALFEKMEVPQQLVDYFTNPEGLSMQKISDFLGMYDRTAYAKEIKEMLEVKFEVTEGLTVERQRFLIARTRATYEEALKLERQSTADEDNVTDLDRPLRDADLKGMQQAWDALHTFRPIKAMRPSLQYKARVYREFTSRAVLLHPVERALSANEDRHRAAKQRVSIGSSTGPDPWLPAFSWSMPPRGSAPSPASWSTWRRSSW